MFRHCRVIFRELVINTLPSNTSTVFQMQLLVIQFTIKMFHIFILIITNSCILNICVGWQGIDYKLPEDDTIVSKHAAM